LKGCAENVWVGFCLVVGQKDDIASGGREGGREGRKDKHERREGGREGGREGRREVTLSDVVDDLGHVLPA